MALQIIKNGDEVIIAKKEEIKMTWRDRAASAIRAFGGFLVKNSEGIVGSPGMINAIDIHMRIVGAADSLPIIEIKHEYLDKAVLQAFTEEVNYDAEKV